MPKMMTFVIGYQEYACTPEQAIAVFQALAPLRQVKRGVKYTDPYIFDGESDIIDAMHLREVVEPVPFVDEPMPDEPLAITEQPLAIPDMRDIF